MKKHLFLMAISIFTVSCSSGVFLEAEHFQDLGGWTVEDQFFRQMGSPYILAHGWKKYICKPHRNDFDSRNGLYLNDGRSCRYRRITMS